jgi:hypothetical protein
LSGEDIHQFLVLCNMSKQLIFFIVCGFFAIFIIGGIAYHNTQDYENAKKCKNKTEGTVVSSEYAGGGSYKYLIYEIEFFKNGRQLFWTRMSLRKDYKIGDAVTVFFCFEGENFIAFTKEEVEKINGPNRLVIK